MGVKIFTADIIYHLFDQMTEYTAKIKNERQLAAASVAVFPVALDIMPNCIFRARDPIVLGVKVTAGCLRIGTPICVPAAQHEDGQVSSPRQDF
jgi:translation initiation factor 5B